MNQSLECISTPSAAGQRQENADCIAGSPCLPQIAFTHLVCFMLSSRRPIVITVEQPAL